MKECITGIKYSKSHAGLQKTGFVNFKEQRQTAIDGPKKSGGQRVNGKGFSCLKIACFPSLLSKHRKWTSVPLQYAYTLQQVSFVLAFFSGKRTSCRVTGRHLFFLFFQRAMLVLPFYQEGWALHSKVLIACAGYYTCTALSQPISLK